MGKTFVALCAALLHAGAALAAPGTQVAVPGGAIPQFVQPLPRLSVAGGTMATVPGNRDVTLSMCEFKAAVLPPGTFAPGVQPLTTVWGYVEGETCPAPTEVRDTYLGPVLVSERGAGPTSITYLNQLGGAATTGVLAYRTSTDQTLHWADPLGGGMNHCNHMNMGGPASGSHCAENYAGPVPAVPHLHGGEVPPEVDGGPDAWFTSDGQYRGHGYYSAAGAPPNGALYRYPNTQEASPAWFHDHTLGATRLNVYAGLAGGYVITDAAAGLPANLPGTAEITPLVLQDRMFDTSGELYFTAGVDAAGVLWALNPEHPYWNPEFVGDVVVVNGKAWPYADVQPRRQRFLLLNGSNARTYELSLTNPVTKANGPAIWVIGTDGGYLDRPVKIDPATGGKLVIMPGERYEVLIDFAAFAGQTLLVRNTAKTPFPAGAAPQGGTTARVLQFRVGACAGACADASYDPASGIPLRSGAKRIVRLADPATGRLAPGVSARVTRQLTLNEVMAMPMTATNPIDGTLTAYPGGPLEILVNNTKWSGESPRTYGDFVPVTVNGVTTLVSELPQEGDTEIWEIVNVTADAHPIHLHLVQFQVLNRQAFNARAYTKAYDAAFPAVPGDMTCTGGVYCPGFGPPLDYVTGNPRALGGNPDVVPYLAVKVNPPLPQEAGWKDTVVAYPGQVTRLAVRWAPTSVPATAPAAELAFPFDPSGGGQAGYVWHCHIIDHEDNEMMRPDMVQLNPLAPAPAERELVKGVHY